MRAYAAGWFLLVGALTLLACGPRQFGAGRPANGPPQGDSDSFRSIGEGEDPEEGVTISDGSDEAFDGVEMEQGEDWYAQDGEGGEAE